MTLGLFPLRLVRQWHCLDPLERVFGVVRLAVGAAALGALLAFGLGDNRVLLPGSIYVALAGFLTWKGSDGERSGSAEEA